MAQNMSFLLNVPYAWEKNVYSALVGYSVLKKSIKSNWLMVLFKSPYILSDFLTRCSINTPQERGIKMYNNWRFVYSPFRFYQVLLHIFWRSAIVCMYAYMQAHTHTSVCVYTLRIITSSSWNDTFIIIKCLSLSLIIFPEVYFVGY